MNKTVFTSENVSENEKVVLTGITSLSLYNQGSTDIMIVTKSVRRILPAFDDKKHDQAPRFEILGDGSARDIEFGVEFAGGSGVAILDYSKLKEC